MENTWEITPQTKWPDFYIKEVWGNLELLLRFVRRDFLASYKQTALGVFWIFIQPLFTALIYVLVFKHAVGISTAGKPGLLFYFGGVILWTFFSESLSAVAYTYGSHASIFHKVYFPRIIVSLSMVLSQLIRLGIQFAIYLVIFGVLLANGAQTVKPNAYAFLFPVVVLILAIMSLGIGLIFTATSAKYRDVQNLLSFLVRVWMFATPIIYPLSLVPAAYKKIIALNPVTPLVEIFRYGFLGEGMHSFWALGYSLIISILVFMAGIILFNLRDSRVMDII
jgi:lipopolysaccharide transport system permease protein